MACVRSLPGPRARAQQVRRRDGHEYRGATNPRIFSAAGFRSLTSIQKVAVDDRPLPRVVQLGSGFRLNECGGINGEQYPGVAPGGRLHWVE